MERDYEVIFLCTPKDLPGPGREEEIEGRQTGFEGSAAKRVPFCFLGLMRHQPLPFNGVVGVGVEGGEIVEGLHRKGVTRVFARPLVPQHLNLHSHRGLVLEVGRVEPVIWQCAVLSEGGSVVGKGEWLVSHEKADGFFPHFSQVLHNGFDLRFNRYHQEAVGRGVSFVGPGPEQGGQGEVGGGGEADSQRPVAPRRRVGEGMSIYLADKPDDCLGRLDVGSPLVTELVIGKTLAHL